MRSITFPITLDYCEHVGPKGWFIARELATNALDSDPGMTMGIMETADEGRTLWVQSRGDGLAIKHLLLGVSEKANAEKAIGQFGEGLKLALLLLTREELRANIYSGNRHLWNEPAEMEGEQVFKIVWEEGNNSHLPFDGTRVEVANWPYESHESRILRAGDPRVVFTDPFGRSILSQDIPDIFVKGIWVQKAKSYGAPYAFGYNLVDVKIGRDRGIVDSWDANGEVGKVWSSVTDPDLLEQFWQAAKDNAGEQNCRVAGLEISSRRAFKQAFQGVYGKRAVLETSDGMAREARHRGAEPVKVGYTLDAVVKDMVGSDVAYVQEMEGASRVHVPDAKLPGKKRNTLKLLRRLLTRAGFSGKTAAYIIPKRLGEAHKGNIRISQSLLGDEREALITALHEAAHAKCNTADATPEHQNAALGIAADIILSYSRRY